MSEKSFLMILGPIWFKIIFWKKKLPNLPKNTDFLNFSKSQNDRKWSELADNYSKTSALPQSLSKIFFVSRTQKFMKTFQKNHPPPPQKKRPFFLGGGDIKYRFRRVWRSIENDYESDASKKRWWVVENVEISCWRNIDLFPMSLVGKNDGSEDGEGRGAERKSYLLVKYLSVMKLGWKWKMGRFLPG